VAVGRRVAVGICLVIATILSVGVVALVVSMRIEAFCPHPITTRHSHIR
jgi:hypothetical protein